MRRACLLRVRGRIAIAIATSVAVALGCSSDKEPSDGGRQAGVSGTGAAGVSGTGAAAGVAGEAPASATAGAESVGGTAGGSVGGAAGGVAGMSGGGVAGDSAGGPSSGAAGMSGAGSAGAPTSTGPGCGPAGSSSVGGAAGATSTGGTSTGATGGIELPAGAGGEAGVAGHAATAGQAGAAGATSTGGTSTGATGGIELPAGAGGEAGVAGNAGTAGQAGAAGAAGAGGVAGIGGAGGSAPTCTDLLKNGNETDVDCGGGQCDPCADSMQCLVAADCMSGVCTANTCQAPVCSDGVKNGVEECDEDDLGDATCESLGFVEGILGCGDDCHFDTSACVSAWVCGDPLVDSRDGKVYGTIALGGLCWMATNLDVGVRIDTTVAQNDPVQIQKYCLNNNEAMCDEYGGLYQWDHAMQYTEAEGATGICPAGWRIPTDQEWKDLEIACGMDPAVADWNNWRGPGVGTALKVGGSSGFDAPLGGMSVSGYSYNFPDYGYYWTSTLGTAGPWRRCFTSGTTYDPTTVGRWQTWGRTYALPIRCVSADFIQGS